MRFLIAICLIVFNILIFAVCFRIPVNAAGGDLIWSRYVNLVKYKYEAPWSVTLSSDERYIYIAGSQKAPSGGDPNTQMWRIEKRKTSDGSLVWAITNQPGWFDNRAYRIILDGDYIYIVGFKCHSYPYWYRVIQKRSAINGSLIWAKSSSSYTPGNGHGTFYGVTTDNNYVYISGLSGSGDKSWYGVIEKRKKGDGSLVWAKDFSYDKDAQIFDIIANGSYLYTAWSIKSENGWRIEKRRKSDAHLIWEKHFTLYSSKAGTAAYSIAGISGNYIYITGIDSLPGNEEWRIEKRRIDNGNLVWVKYSNPSNTLGWDTDRTYQSQIYSDRIFVVGYTKKGGDKRWRIESRRLSDGAFDWSKEVNHSSSEDDVAIGVSVGVTGMYITGHTTSKDSNWAIEKRNNGISVIAHGLAWSNNGNPVAFIDKNGNMYLEGALHTGNAGNGKFKIKCKGSIVGSIDTSGNLYLKGNYLSGLPQASGFIVKSDGAVKAQVDRSGNLKLKGVLYEGVNNIVR